MAAVLKGYKMSLLKNFAENTHIFRGDENRIDYAAFEALTQEHGEDVAKGYLKAMFEFTEILNNILLIEKGHTSNFPETPANTFGKVSNLHKALFDFVSASGLEVDKLKKPRSHVTRAQGF